MTLSALTDVWLFVNLRKCFRKIRGVLTLHIVLVATTSLFVIIEQFASDDNILLIIALVIFMLTYIINTFIVGIKLLSKYDGVNVLGILLMARILAPILSIILVGEYCWWINLITTMMSIGVYDFAARILAVTKD